MTYLSPILLADTDFKEVRVSDNLSIRPITENEMEDFFGIKKVLGDWEGKRFNLKGIGSLTTQNHIKYNPSEWFNYRIFKKDIKFFGSNYVICTTETNSNELDNLSKKINTYFNIIEPTETLSLIWLNDNSPSIIFTGDTDFLSSGFTHLNINQINPEELNNFINSKSSSEFIYELYLKALHSHSSMVSKFTFCITALETLYLSKISSEITFRFSLRIANILGESNDEKRKLFKEANNIYKYRSKLLHGENRNNFENKIYEDSIQLLYRSIKLYSKDPNMFTYENFKSEML